MSDEQFENLLIARDKNESCYLSIQAHREIDDEIKHLFYDYLKYRQPRTFGVVLI